MKTKLLSPQVCKGTITCYRQRQKTRGEAAKGQHLLMKTTHSAFLLKPVAWIFVLFLFSWIWFMFGYINIQSLHTTYKAQTCLIQIH